MSTRAYLSIGDVLSLLREEFPDVTISKIRFLESQGLVNPERSPSGYRKFYEQDVERLRWVLRQQREHFLPLKVIRDRLAREGDAVLNGDAPEPHAAPHAAVADAPAPAPAPAAPAPAVAPAAAAVPAGGGNGSGHPAPPAVQPVRTAAATRLPADQRVPAAVGGAATPLRAETVHRAEPHAGAAVRPPERPAPPAGTAGPVDPPPAHAPAAGPPERPSRPERAVPAAAAVAPEPRTPSSVPHEAPPAPSPSPGSTTGTGGGTPPGQMAGGAGAAHLAGASLTLEELCSASGLAPGDVAALEGFGMLVALPVAGVEYYDEEALVVARLVAEFARYGIEPRHLRLYRNAVEREMGLVEQIVTPLLRQRNPEARQRAVDAANDVARLGQALRSSLLRRELRRQLGG